MQKKTHLIFILCCLVSVSRQYATINLGFYILSYTFFKLHFGYETHCFTPFRSSGESAESSLKVWATNRLVTFVRVTRPSLAREIHFEKYSLRLITKIMENYVSSFDQKDFEIYKHKIFDKRSVSILFVEFPQDSFLKFYILYLKSYYTCDF